MKKSRIEQMSMEVTVGAFMFMVLLSLGVFTIILSSENIFTQKHHVEVLFDDVMGLRDGDNVMVRGLKVGKVHKLWLEPDGVHLTLSTSEPLRVREDYVVEILPASVLGGRYLQVNLGSPELPLVAEGVVLLGSVPVDLIEEATETFIGIKAALMEGGVLENLEVTMAELRTLSERLNQGEGTLGKLLSDDSAYTQFVAVAENLQEVTSRLRDGEGTVGRLLNDDTLARDLESTVGNLKEVSRRLSEGEGLLGKLLSDDESVYEDLRETMASLREVSELLRSGEGTLGKLLTDDSMHKEVDLLLREVRAAVDDMRETAPITSFTSIFFGAL